MYIGIYTGFRVGLKGSGFEGFGLRDFGLELRPSGGLDMSSVRLCGSHGGPCWADHKLRSCWMRFRVGSLLDSCCVADEYGFGLWGTGQSPINHEP